MSWYVDPSSEAARQVVAWSNTDPADAAEMAKIARQPTARWFGAWDTNVRSAVHSYVQAAAANRTVPVLVAYDNP
jgi:endoglucanase